MRSWSDIEHRREATLLFAEFMNAPENAATRTRCCSDGDFAREQFALVGEFYLENAALPNQPPNDGSFAPIPAVVKFKVYNSDDAERDNLAILILPPASQPIPKDPMEIWTAGDMWRLAIPGLPQRRAVTRQIVIQKLPEIRHRNRGRRMADQQTNRNR